MIYLRGIGVQSSNAGVVELRYVEGGVSRQARRSLGHWVEMLLNLRWEILRTARDAVTMAMPIRGLWHAKTLNLLSKVSE